MTKDEVSGNGPMASVHRVLHGKGASARALSSSTFERNQCQRTSWIPIRSIRRSTSKDCALEQRLKKGHARSTESPTWCLQAVDACGRRSSNFQSHEG